MKGGKIRPIDADALKEKINKRLEAIELAIIFNDKNEKVETALDEIHSFWCNAVDIIEEQPTVGQWIPCSKELPRVQRWVLITYVWDDDSTRYTGYGHRISNSEFYAISGERGELTLLKNYKVIAWQPLPEPHRGDK